MTTRRFPQLAHWGAFTAIVENGKLVSCEPFADDPCPTAMLGSIVPMVYSDKRIRRPAVRRSWLEKRAKSDGALRGREDFVEVGWDVAMDLVASEISRVRAEHGPSGILGGSYGWSSAGRVHHARTLIRRFHFSGGGCVDQEGNYSWGAAQYLLPHVIGTYSPLTGRVTSWLSIIENTEVFVAFGGLALKNFQVSSGGTAEHTQEGWLRKLASKRIKVFNISPTREDCPEFLNAEWIPIRPNTDVALMLALAHELYRRGAADREFLKSHCTGGAELESYITGQSDGTAKDAEWASGITGIPASRIVALADSLCGARTYLTCAFSLQRAHHGEQPYWMLIALASILGQIGLQGGGFGFGHGSMNGVGNPRIATPGPEMPSGANPARLSIPCARVTDMLLSPGQPYEFNGKTREYPDVRLVHWAGGNPFHHHQQLNRLVEAWARPETVIVNDIWWTPVAQRADIVLPATTSLERNDIGGSSRDRYVLAMHKAIDPLHQARGDFDIFTELAQRLGHGDAFTEKMDEWGWIKAIYERCADSQRRAGVETPDFEAFWDRGYISVPGPSKDFVLFEDFRNDPNAHPLQTPSGKIELFSKTIAGFGYTDCGGHPQWLPPQEWLGAGAAQAHPLHLITVQPTVRLHSQLDPAPLSQDHKVAGVERVTIHRLDAQARGIREGDRVRIFNQRGSCMAGATLSDDILRGVLVGATGAWFDPDPDPEMPERNGTTNVLTLDIGTSQLTQATSAMTCLVEIEAYSQSEDTRV